jgi:hypothetical protein
MNLANIARGVVVGLVLLTVAAWVVVNVSFVV